MRLPVLALCAVLFFGCQHNSDSLPYPLTLSTQGVGAIHLGESFDIALLRGKLPGFELDTLSRVASAKEASVIRLKRGDEVIAMIAADQTGSVISEIIILSPLIKNMQGMGINDTLPPDKDIRCVRDECRYTGEPSIAYRIESNTRTIREIMIQPL